MNIYSFSPFGYEGTLVSVEVDLRRGIPAVDIVGLADGAVKESRERMRSAIRNSGFDFPPERVLISLSPADLKKEGAGFDLAIALSVLHAKELDDESQENFAKKNTGKEDSILVMGELELNGKLRPVRGIHAAAGTAMNTGISKCIVPSANSSEAREVNGMKVFGADNLLEAFSSLYDENKFLSKNDLASSQCFQADIEDIEEIDGVFFPKIEEGNDFSDVKNQPKLLRALQIAAAGSHNLLAFGPPGCGKTLSLQKFPSLLPLLTLEESQSVTRIYSIAGLLSGNSNAMYRKPFRQPHQTATIEGMCGGGPHCTPGEISLAHNGVLFLDEAAEFRTSVLQMLRVPLEGGSITLSRAGRSTVFPANFQLLMATNPCPCGFYGSKDKICLCSSRSVEQYWKKFSGPLLDRMDIRINAGEKLKETCTASSTRELRKPIAKAIKIQRLRQGKMNSQLNISEIEKYCTCSGEADDLLQKQCEYHNFSPRARSSILKLGRTIADMSGKEIIDESIMLEAVDLRKTEGGLALGLM